MSAVVQPVPSPYARAAPELTALGYHVIPIMPLEKAPGEYRGGEWRRMSKWERFRDKAPSEFERGLWSRNMPEANVSIVLGSPAGDGLRLVAVDVDATDPDAFDSIASAIPHSPMVKKGAKGETRFYRAPPAIRSKPYNDTRDGRRIRLVDVLTGYDTRQTVVPPSVHVHDAGRPSGLTYVWLCGPVAAVDLPLFDADALERLEDTLRHLGWDPEQQKRPAPEPRPMPDEDDFFSETKAAALADLAAWVPELDLYNCRPARGGYEAVATWRPSSTGRPVEVRKRNLSIQASGIKDFGTDEGYSAIDLVMAALGVERAQAVSWLRDRLGLGGGEPILLRPSPRPATIEVVDLETGEVTEERARPSPAAPSVEEAEFPDELTRVPGLLGELTDWIADSGRRPQRALSLGAAITLIGTAAGRKYAGPTRTGTHLYVLGMARSGAGKDHPLNCIPRVLAAANMSAHIGPSQFMSLSALVNRITRHPLTLSGMDEVGSFIARINSRKASTHERAITGMLRTVWGASFQTVSPPEWAGRSADPIHSPSLSIYGVSTPEEFYAALTGGDVHNGFLNRFLLFSTRARPTEREPKCDAFVVPDAVRLGMMAIYGSGSALTKATMHNGQADAPMITAAWNDAAARKAYEDFGREIEAREADQSFLARTVEMSQRLALIRAIGCCASTPVITVDDMAWGRAVALWSAEKMIVETSDYMAENENQAQANRIVRTIREAGEIGHSALLRKMQCQVKGRDLKELIDHLVEAGRIGFREGEAPPQGGKKPRTYVVTEP